MPQSLMSPVLAFRNVAIILSTSCITNVMESATTSPNAINAFLSEALGHTPLEAYGPCNVIQLPSKIAAV